LRIGHGFDSHEFKPGVKLVIGGLEIACDSGLAGHSDGDVLLHAVTDALLGAASGGDIGSHFPPSDPQWKGAASSLFVGEAMRIVTGKGYKVVNLDATLILKRPKIGPLREQLQASVATLLGVEPDAVSIKAKTPEGLNLDGTAQAHAVVLLEKIS
jgi:2-C-methyl-D-erythritol 2,4-cyclodiphosphate synthase